MKKPTKITRLSDITDSCFQVSPDQAIEDLQGFLAENQEFDKVLLIAVSTKDNEFNYAWFKAKMACSETITALNLSLADQTDMLRG